MSSDKKQKKTRRKTGERKQGVSDFTVLLIISGAVILSIIFIAAIIFTSPS